MHLPFIFCLHDDTYFCSFWADATSRALVSLLPTICPILYEVEEKSDKLRNTMDRATDRNE